MDTSQFKTKMVKEIDEKTISIYNQLEELSDPEFITCLRKFNDSYDFIEWIRKNAPSIYTYFVSIHLVCI